MVMKATGVIGPKELPMRLRKAVVELDGEQIGFWLDPKDHPEVYPRAEVLVEFDPQDQVARIGA